MTYSVRNKSKYPIIGNLGDGSTLRLPVSGKITITDEQFKGYVSDLVESGDVAVIPVSELTPDGDKFVEAGVPKSKAIKKKED